MSELLAPLEWYTTQRKVSELIPCDFNPRQITDEELGRLKVSLEKFNLVEIPAIDIDNVLLAGHQRIAAMFILGRGDESIDVRIPNRKLTEDEFKEYMLRSNIHNGDFDWNKIEEFFQDIDLSGIGMDMDAYDDFLRENSSLPPEAEGEFDADLPVESVSVEGDLYEFISEGKSIKHILLCGDSTISDNFDKILGDDKINLMTTDPPYNVDYQGGTKDKLKIKNDKMSDDNFYRFLYDFFVNSYVFSHPGAPAYVFYSDSEAINFRSAMQNAGYKISSTLIWVKNSFVLGRLDYHMQHEPVLYVEETVPEENHQSIIYGWNKEAAHPWYSDRKQSSVLNFDKPLRNADHPTMKPLDLISYVITNSSKQMDIIFDGFLGSGTTLIASEKNWRQCRGFELDPRFADVIVRRWVTYMRENKLSYRVLRNGVELDQSQIQEYFKSEE
ncbi:DNA modification methylase [Epilithonimonas hominis]|uniref:DNA modification methylase n=1 Tax=Epilithonimonas hominis TaxID=420404 RepID=UPI002896F286|nr:DNA modification methylase [Epilithonimonas hominis]